MEDGPAKTALALKVFGKAGAELIPLLNEGRDGIARYSAELRSLGGEVSPETAKAADEFNDNLDKLKVTAGGLALQMATALLPTLVDIQKQLQAGVTPGNATAETFKFIGEAVSFLVNTLRAAIDIIQAFASAVQAADAKLSELKSRASFGLLGDAEYFKTLADVAKDDTISQLEQAANRYAQAKTGMQAQAASLVGLYYSGGPAGGRGAGAGRKAGAIDRLYRPEPKAAKSGGKSDAQRAAEELENAYQRMNAQMREQIALFGQTSQEAKVRYDLENGELAKLSEAKKAELLTSA